MYPVRMTAVGLLAAALLLVAGLPLASAAGDAPAAPPIAIAGDVTQLPTQGAGPDDRLEDCTPEKWSRV